MPHIHTEPNQHDATVSMFILRREPRAILLHRHRIVNLWAQFGGHIELIENPWETVAHELDEETGYKLEQLNVLQYAPRIGGLIETIHPTPVVYRSHEFPVEPRHVHTDAAFAFVTDEEPAGQPHEDESQDLRWFTTQELFALPDDQVIPDSRTIALHLLAKMDDYLEYPAASFAH